jgi:hypothetical protein
MARKQTPHIRRWHPGAINGKLRLDCDCGWRGELLVGMGTLEDLDKQFVEHIPPALRESYLLVDQRPSNVGMPGSEVINVDGELEPSVMLARGNWIMPANIPCTVLRWYENGDEYRAVVRKFQFAAPEIDILVGEVRTADGQVIALA